MNVPEAGEGIAVPYGANGNGTLNGAAGASVKVNAWYRAPVGARATDLVYLPEAVRVFGGKVACRNDEIGASPASDELCEGRKKLPIPVRVSRDLEVIDSRAGPIKRERCGDARSRRHSNEGPEGAITNIRRTGNRRRYPGLQSICFVILIVQEPLDGIAHISFLVTVSAVTGGQGVGPAHPST